LVEAVEQDAIIQSWSASAKGATGTAKIVDGKGMERGTGRFFVGNQRWRELGKVNRAVTICRVWGNDRS
jgi:hypothetical protein